MNLLKRFAQPEFGAAVMLGLLAGIELGQVAARAYNAGMDALFESNRALWMLASIVIAVTIAWRLLRYPLAGKAMHRSLLIVILHAVACWRFLSIELAILATLPVFALAAAAWLQTGSAADHRPGKD